MTRGKLSVADGSQPKKVGRALTPVSIKSCGVAGMGGNGLWDDCRNSDWRRAVNIGPVPLIKLSSTPSQR